MNCEWLVITIEMMNDNDVKDNNLMPAPVLSVPRDYQATLYYQMWFVDLTK